MLDGGRKIHHKRPDIGAYQHVRWSCFKITKYQGPNQGCKVAFVLCLSEYIAMLSHTFYTKLQKKEMLLLLWQNWSTLYCPPNLQDYHPHFYHLLYYQTIHAQINPNIVKRLPIWICPLFYGRCNYQIQIDKNFTMKYDLSKFHLTIICFQCQNN